MTPPTERVTPKERKWLEQIAISYGMFKSSCGTEIPESSAVAALSEVLTKTKEACAKHIDNLVSKHSTDFGSKQNLLIARVQDEAAEAIRNLEITGE